MSMDNTSKPAWLFGVLFISLAVDIGNIFRLVHGSVPFPFLVPWLVAGVVTLLLALSKAYTNRTVRIMLWIVLSLAVLVVSILSDGTNLSLWVWIGITLGPVTSVRRRQLLAALLGVAHIVTQGVLLPLPIHNAPMSYLIIQLTGLFALIVWRQWRKPAVILGNYEH